jgi:hypothetical protein
MSAIASEYHVHNQPTKHRQIGRRVNPTETIYAALPAFLYLNANITGALLEPLLRFQDSPAYENHYAAPDLGTKTRAPLIAHH